MPRKESDMRKLLDLFCGAGGAGVGYSRAGFEVVGVDIHPQPNYPFEFHQGDAMSFNFDGFDVIHASPPCQSYSRAMRHLSKPQPKLVDSLRGRLEGRLYVIENTPGCPLIDPLVLCGTSFGLRIWRHRLFECPIRLVGLKCCHTGRPINPHCQSGRDLIKAEFGNINPELVWRDAAGLDWMTKQQEWREAIPPVYTEYIGKQILRFIGD
jgi:DNA (cytosine-5)-methyltransferase 1